MASIAINDSIAGRCRAWSWYPGKVVLSFDNAPDDERGDVHGSQRDEHVERHLVRFGERAVMTWAVIIKEQGPRAVQRRALSGSRITS
jgi:hypothetical protein